MANSLLRQGQEGKGKVFGRWSARSNREIGI